MSEEKVNMLDMIFFIVKNKMFVIVFTLLMSVLAVIYTLVVPVKWTSELVLLPKDDSSSLSAFGSVMGALGLSSSFSLSSFSNKYATIMKGKIATEETIRKFDLLNYFKITEKDPLKAMDIAIASFHRSIFSVTVSMEDSYILVEVTTKDKELSRAIAQHYLDFLTDYAQNNTTNSGRQKRELFESRVAVLTEELRNVSDELRQYQAKHNIVHVETQAISAIQSYSKIFDDLLMVGFDLKYLERYMTSATRQSEFSNRSEVITETMHKLESDTKETPYSLPLNKLNDHIFVVQDFMFRQLILQKTLETIYPQFELARIEEAEEMDKFEVLEYPTLPGIKSFPKRSLICILVFFTSLLLSAGMVIAKELTSEEDKEKIKEIWKTLFR